MSVKNSADIVAVMGDTGSGKSAWVKRRIAGARRLLIWDPMHEYGAHGVVHDKLADVAAALGAKTFALVFQPSADAKAMARQFDLFCRLALAAGNLTVLVEELRFVTTPSRSPLGWAQVNLTGRHKGLRVIGTSQRPASIDKDFLGSATLVHTGLLGYPEDVKAVAARMRIAPAEIDALAPLDWIEFNKTTKKITRGRLTF